MKTSPLAAVSRGALRVRRLPGLLVASDSSGAVAVSAGGAPLGEVARRAVAVPLLSGAWAASQLAQGAEGEPLGREGAALGVCGVDEVDKYCSQSLVYLSDRHFPSAAVALAATAIAPARHELERRKQ